MADCIDRDDRGPTIQSPILWRNSDHTVILIDIAHSISKAQESHDAPSFRHLVSSSPPLTPFPSNEPKSASARAKLESNSIATDLHSDYRSLLEWAIKDVHQNHDGQWCLPRPFVEEAPREAKKRKLDVDGLPDDVLLSVAHGSRERSQKYVSRLEHSPRHHAGSLRGSDEETNFITNILSNNEEHTTLFKIQSTINTASFIFFIPPGASFCIGDCADPRSFHAAIRRQAQHMNTRKQFDFILLDPPWPNRSVKRTHKTPGSTYSTSPTLWEIRELLLEMDLDMLMADKCLVGVWITNKPAVRELVLGEDGIFACWGVELVEEWLWLKTTAYGDPLTPLDGIWRKPYEILLLGRKRRTRAEDPDRSFDEPGGNVKRRVLVGVPDLHSRKPCLKELIEPLMSDRRDYRALEVFARHLVAGWWSWGNECIKFNWEKFWRGQDVASGHAMPREDVEN